MGDELFKRLSLEDESTWSAPALLNPENHTVVEQLHQEFIQAGASLITTCNFSVRTRNGFNSEEIFKACKAAGFLARKAANSFKERNIQVLGSLPPLQDCFRKDSCPTEISQYEPIIDGLNSYCDFFIGETLSSTQEAFQILETTKRTGKSCMISFSLSTEGNLYSGETPATAVQSLLLPNLNTTGIFPVAILFNCSSPELIKLGLESLQSSSITTLLQKNNCELGVYPNRYFPVNPDWTNLSQPIRMELTPHSFTEFCLDAIKNHRVTIVGGCCGITPNFINELNSLMLNNHI